MSTYYKIVCDHHKERCDASSTAGSGCPVGDALETIWPFLIAHHRCSLRVVNEHTDVYYDDTFYEWSAENATSDKQNPWTEREAMDGFAMESRAVRGDVIWRPDDDTLYLVVGPNCMLELTGSYGGASSIASNRLCRKVGTILEDVVRMMVSIRYPEPEGTHRE